MLINTPNLNEVSLWYSASKRAENGMGDAFGVTAAQVCKEIWLTFLDSTCIICGSTTDFSNFISQFEFVLKRFHIYIIKNLSFEIPYRFLINRSCGVFEKIENWHHPNRKTVRIIPGHSTVWFRICSMHRYLSVSFTGDGIGGEFQTGVWSCCQPRWDTDVFHIGLRNSASVRYTYKGINQATNKRTHSRSHLHLSITRTLRFAKVQLAVNEDSAGFLLVSSSLLEKHAEIQCLATSMLFRISSQSTILSKKERRNATRLTTVEDDYSFSAIWSSQRNFR